MQREIILTADGSHTIAVPELNVAYHSRHGAVQESVHVFIQAGLCYVRSRPEPPGTLRLFEMGFGTGLNAFLTAIEAEKTGTKIHYTAVETSPLSEEETIALNYPEILGRTELFQQLHQCKWNEDAVLNDFFTIKKVPTELFNFSTAQPFHVIYYDAFAPSAQPELWTKEVFQKLFSMLEEGGALVTYCAKGDVRRAMLAAGFAVKKLPGPPGKREMLRATSPPSPLGERQVRSTVIIFSLDRENRNCKQSGFAQN